MFGVNIIATLTLHITDVYFYIKNNDKNTTPERKPECSISYLKSTKSIASINKGYNL